jgi:hypothetical protein
MMLICKLGCVMSSRSASIPPPWTPAVSSGMEASHDRKSSTRSSPGVDSDSGVVSSFSPNGSAWSSPGRSDRGGEQGGFRHRMRWSRRKHSEGPAQLVVGESAGAGGSVPAGGSVDVRPPEVALAYGVGLGPLKANAGRSRGDGNHGSPSASEALASSMLTHV